VIVAREQSVILLTILPLEKQNSATSVGRYRRALFAQKIPILSDGVVSFHLP
jgi:hypothetical protein